MYPIYLITYQYYLDAAKFMKQGNVLFNDVLNTFYLGLYSVEHMVKERVRKSTGTTIWTTLSN